MLIVTALFFTAIILLLVIIGTLTKIYSLKRKIKIYSRHWLSINMFVIILVAIIVQIAYYFAFGRKPDFMEIIIGTIILIGVYIYFRIIVPKYFIRNLWK